MEATEFHTMARPGIFVHMVELHAIACLAVSAAEAVWVWTCRLYACAMKISADLPAILPPKKSRKNMRGEPHICCHESMGGDDLSCQ